MPFTRNQLSFGFDGEIEEVKDETYTKNINIPQYEPRMAIAPKIEDLIDQTKTYELLRKIKRANITEEQKLFLKFAAMRHLVFNYGLIAEYYAHQDKEMQKLMEDSALVIIDIDDAIANGYVVLSKNIETIMNETGEKAGEIK